MEDLVRFVRGELSRLADPAKAAGMAAYMKTDMPCYGVTKPARARLEREVHARFPLTRRADYRAAVLALWSQPHREEKYLAVAVARHHPRFITFSSVPLYRRLIVEGAWWDFVDEVAAHLVGRVLLHQRARLRPTLDRWIDHPDLWLRRAALLSQLTHREQTDTGQLFDYCRRRAHEKEFFIRKAIGWALRAYAWTDPAAVGAFVAAHRAELSPLSVREATKHL